MTGQRTASRFVCRFAAGDNSGMRSGEWRVWASKNQPDLCVAIRSLGQIKATVHCPRANMPTCRRHYGFSWNAKGAVAEADRASGSSRHKGTWVGAHLGNGCSLEYKIFIPAAALSKTSVPASPDTLLIPPPEGDQSLVVAVILAPPNMEGYPKMQGAETRLLADGRLHDGRRVCIVYGYDSVKYPTAPNQISFPLPPTTSVEEIRALAAQGSLRVFAIIKNDDGSLGILDGRLDPKPRG